MQFSKRARGMLKYVATGILLVMSVGSIASDGKPPKAKSAIVLATFGTTYDSALGALLDIKAKIEQAYPETPVRFAFTSNIIRKKWHARQQDQSYQQQHPRTPLYLYQVKNVLGTMADLQNEGYKNIVVQTTLLSHGEEYIDLKAYVDALASIKTLKAKWQPFHKIALGRPLMGTWGDQYAYHHDLKKLVNALAEDVKLAKHNHSALVYMGHGNNHLSTGLYYELGELMNQTYPDVHTYVGLVEGHPDFETLLKQIKAAGVTRVTLKPLMVVAGDHANNDMAGDEDDAWKVRLMNEQIQVIPILEGLGSKASIQALYLSHLIDAARDANITLK